MSLTAQIVETFQLGYPLLNNIVACTTLIVWDTLLTFNEERVFIQLSKASTWVKVLYCMSRYIALAIYIVAMCFFVGSHEQLRFCSKIMWLVSFAGTAIIACSHILLIQRVYAFCGRSKLLLWALSFLFLLNQTSGVVILSLEVLPEFVVVDLQGNLPALFGNCVIMHYSRTLSLIFFLGLEFHIIAFACIIIRVASLRFTSWRTGVRVPSLYADFLKDGIWVFMFSSLVSLLPGVYIRAESFIGLSFAAWSYVISSICCTRLILNLNHSVNRDRDFGRD